MKIPRPQASEMTTYQVHYVNQVQGDVMEVLHNHIGEFEAIISGMTEVQLEHRYAPEKWSIRQVIMHVVDAEQVFAYRAMCISRGETGILPGFDHDQYMAHTSYKHLGAPEILNAFITRRNATIHLFKNLNEGQWEMMGRVSDYSNSVRALAYVIAGHAQHHLNILKDRYL